MRVSFSNAVVVLILLFALGRIFYTGRWQDERVIDSDARGYCSYLPTTIVLHDPFMKTVDEVNWEDRGKYWIYDGKDGAHYPKMTMGVALLVAPFYVIAHAVAPFLGYKANGWSPPYQLAVALAALFYLAVALSLLRLLLLDNFSDRAVAITLFLLFFATNLMYYATDEIAMSHVFSFSLLAICTWFTHRWLRLRVAWHVLVLAFLFALLILVRPTNGVFLLYPALLVWMQARKGDFAYSALFNGWLIFAALIFFALLSVQLLFWKGTTGHYFFSSYGNERLIFSNAQILLGWFSFRNGWLLYSPFLLSIFPGIWLLNRQRNEQWIIVAILLLVHSYVVFSWWCWYYGNSLGIRTMIDAYAVFTPAIAASVAWALQRKNLWLKGVLATLALFLLLNNAFQYRQYAEGSMDGSEMTSRSFWKLFMNPETPGHLRYLGYYRQVDTERLLLGLPERENPDTIELMDLGSIQAEKGDSAIVEMELNGGREYGPSFTRACQTWPREGRVMLELRYSLRCDNFQRTNVMAVVGFDDGDAHQGYFSVPLKDANLQEGQWQEGKIIVPVPGELTQGTVMKAYIWKVGKGTMTAGNIRGRLIKIGYGQIIR